MGNKKKWIIAIKIVIFVLLFCVMAEGMGKLVYPKTGETTPKMMLYRQQEEAPDIFLLGTSAIFRGVMPLMLEEASGMTVTDMSTPGQTALSSLTLLKDTIRQGKIPETVVVYTNMRLITGKDGDWDFQVMANLPMSLDKLYMMLNGFDVEDWPEAMLEAVRGRENFTIKKMRRNLRARYVMSTNPEEAPEDIRPYVGRGYNYTEVAQDPDSINLPYGAIDSFSRAEADFGYYEQMINICKKHDIEMILICVPRLPATIIASSDYDGFHQYLTEKAKEHDITFWDLTYLRPEVMEITATHFQDGYHGNTSFALPFSELLGRMIKEHKAGTLDVSAYLYDDFETYLNLHKGINAIFARNSPLVRNGAQVVDVQLIVGADTEAEFRMLVAPAGTEDYVLFRDWGQQERVTFTGALPAGKYDIKIEARLVGEEEVRQTIYKTYNIK